jgi:hypothetical protein
MCKKTYFNHDCDARNDEKLIALRIRYGAEGYGVYFMLIEMLQAAPGCTLEKDYKALAFDLRVSARRIKAIVEDFGLFTPTDGGKKFYSERLVRYATEVDESERRRSEAAQYAASMRWDAENGMRIASEKHANRIEKACESHKAAPDAEIKEENEREKETFPPITPYKEKEKAKEESVSFMARARENESGVGDADSDLEAWLTPVEAESVEADAPGRADHNGMSTETLHASSETLQARPETLQAEAVEEIETVEAEEVTTPTDARAASPARTPMKRPTLEEVQAYVTEKGYSVDAESFIAFYESNGWKVGKNPMKSWRAALVTWQKRNANASNAPQFNPQTPNFNGQGFTKTLAEQRRDRNNEECADFFARKMAEINAREMARREGAAGAL